MIDMHQERYKFGNDTTVERLYEELLGEAIRPLRPLPEQPDTIEVDKLPELTDKLLIRMYSDNSVMCDAF